jgi:N-acetylneuraminate lyase
MTNSVPLHGLVAAVHTPFDASGALRLDAVEAQAAHLLRNGVGAAFVGGTTGESASLTVDERMDLARRWIEVARGTSLRVVVHVGSNCLEDARRLAAQAGTLGAAAISAIAPSYFKPGSIDTLVACCARIASAAPETPFYYYDIPPLTGITLSSAEFLHRAPAAIPNLAGLKYSNPDLMTLQRCIGMGFDVPFGIDEHLLGAMAMGVRGAVGSGYNFAAPVYRRMMEAFDRGDWAGARMEQARGSELVRILAARGYMGSAKALMGMLGVDVGGPRLPFHALSAEEAGGLRRELEAMGFFEWVA